MTSMRDVARRAVILCVVLATGLISATSTSVHGRTATIVDASATVDAPTAHARRRAVAPPSLTGRIDDIAILGDSLFFEELPPVVRVNTVIPLIRSTLHNALGDRNIRVRNLSRPGLAIKYPVRSGPFEFISLSEWIPMIFDDPSDYPDLVVIPATGIDLNLKHSVPVDSIVPELVDEMGRIVAELRALGMQVVIVPAFGVNDAMYDALISAATGSDLHHNTNSRINALNAALGGSGLPMLFTRYRGLDLDADGDVDEANFVDFGSGVYPDDGIHSNTTGERVIAVHVARALVEALSVSRSR
jgi:lysophospholipase L1-like esterase